jgi:hypothetical protein
MDTKNNYAVCINYNQSRGFGFLRALNADLTAKREPDLFVCHRFLVGDTFLLSGDVVSFRYGIDEKSQRKVALGVEVVRRAVQQPFPIGSLEGLGTPKSPNSALAALGSRPADDDAQGNR